MYWRVVIRLHNSTTIHSRLPNRLAAEVMRRACVELIDDRLFHDATLVCCQAAPPSGDEERRSGQHWCPYCRAYRRYWNSNGYKLCEVCWVSDADFYWKKYNSSAPRVKAVSEDKKRRRERRKARRAIS